MRNRITRVMEDFELDAVILPYRSLPPPEGTGTSATGDTNNLTSTTGLPAVIMPGGYTQKSLPVGIQFVGKPFDDLTLLQVAHGYEQVSRRRQPPASTPPLRGEKFSY